MTTNVAAKPVTFLHGTNHVCRSLTCATVIPSLLQETSLSNSIPHRVISRTEAVNHAVLFATHVVS